MSDNIDPATGISTALDAKMPRLSFLATVPTFVFLVRAAVATVVGVAADALVTACGGTTTTNGPAEQVNFSAEVQTGTVGGVKQIVPYITTTPPHVGQEKYFAHVYLDIANTGPTIASLTVVGLNGLVLAGALGIAGVPIGFNSGKGTKGAVTVPGGLPKNGTTRFRVAFQLGQDAQPPPVQFQLVTDDGSTFNTETVTLPPLSSATIAEIYWLHPQQGTAVGPVETLVAVVPRRHVVEATVRAIQATAREVG